MSENCNSDCGSCKQDCAIRKEPQNEKSRIKKIIGIVSGKGGVGKSIVTSMLASGMNKRCHQTAILDADITGPSIPKAFNLKGISETDGDFIVPHISSEGVKVMSLNLLMENETDPVVWRGPIIAGTVKQFYTEVAWGDVDYMFVDMPPGTGDVPLTVFQSLPIEGVVVVTSPQDLVKMIVKKAFNMAEMMKVPVLGIVENYSYVKCPDCGKEIRIFGESHIDEIAAELHAPVLGKMPIDMEFASKADSGAFDAIVNEYVKAADEVMPK